MTHSASLVLVAVTFLERSRRLREQISMKHVSNHVVTGYSRFLSTTRGYPRITKTLAMITA